MKIVSKERIKEHTFHIYCIRTELRDKLKNYLETQGIQTLIHYPIPCFRQPVYSKMKLNVSDYPVADKVSKELLSLPIGPHLGNKEIINVSEAIKEFFKKINK